MLLVSILRGINYLILLLVRTLKKSKIQVSFIPITKNNAVDKFSKSTAYLPIAYLPIAYLPIAYLPIACCLFAYCLLPIAYCLLPVAYLPIAYCLFAYLPIAYCLLPVLVSVPLRLAEAWTRSVYPSSERRPTRGLTAIAYCLLSPKCSNFKQNWSY